MAQFKVVNGEWFDKEMIGIQISKDGRIKTQTGKNIKGSKLNGRLDISSNLVAWADVGRSYKGILIFGTRLWSRKSDSLPSFQFQKASCFARE